MGKASSQPTPTLRVNSSDGTLLAYERWGSGPPVVLVDGAFCSRRFGPTDKLAPLLAERFTVYAYDRRGRGESADNKAYALEREVEDLGAIVAAAGGSACVFGMSSGGVLALEAAARGAPVKKLAIYEAPYIDGEAAHRPPLDLAATLKTFLDKGDRGGAVKFYMSKVMQMPWLMVNIIPLTPHWSPLKASAPSLPYEAALMGDFQAPVERLAQISVPTLAIAGSRGKELMRTAAATVASAVPRASSKVLPGQSHNVSMDVLAPVLIKFFESP